MRLMNRSFLNFALALLASNWLVSHTAFETTALAQDATSLPMYQVEMIVVRHVQPVYGTELFPLDAPLKDEEPLEAQRFIPLSANELTMSEVAAKLAKSSRYELISHAGWTQPGFARDEAKRKVILRTNANGDQLSGSAVMSRERYLRLVFDLTVTINGERFFMETGRRMISRQIHYFDHPHFGVIAKITPLK